MKIKKIDVYQLDLPYSGGTYELSGGRTYTSFDATFVCITTDTGLEGWGESTPFGATYIAAHAYGVRAGIAEMAPYLIGRDPRQVDRINDTMDQSLVGHNHAKTPIDVACWDVFGKSVDLPVCELSVQETTGSDIAFAAIVQLAQTVQPNLLRSVLECRDMVTLTTAQGNYPIINGCVRAPSTAGLGITPNMAVLGNPVASYS